MADRPWVGLLVALGILVVILGLALAGWIASSAAEARAFERVTGKRVSTLDAMFLDLRVQEPTK